MNDVRSRIREIEEEGYDFNFSAYLEKGFETFSKHAGLFLAFSVVYVVILFLVEIIPFIGAIAANTFLAPCLTVGYFLVAHKIASGENAIEFGDFFKGFNFISKLIVISIFTGLIIAIMVVPVLVVTFFAALGGFSSFPFWIFVLLIPAIYLGVAYAAAPFLAVFYDMEPWEAMETSRKIISRKWFTVFGFFIVTGLILCAGALLLGVGMLVALPIVCLAIYYAFADIMQLREGVLDEGSDEDVMRHLV